MKNWNTIVLFTYGVLSLFFFIKGFRETKIKKNAFGATPYLFLFGIYVWGDAVVFGAFWFLVTFTSILLNDWILFLLILSLFWVVRSFGETIYWLSQQFSKVNREPPEKLCGYKIFQNESIWFAYQITNQCISVIALVFSIYLSKVWLLSKF
ncbi:hypothetical protein JXA63_04545 [Candidatus Woesebacteria bacterium]|nr:hypothetical protein [Candidatus Woesebacteria bacterium]